MSFILVTYIKESLYHSTPLTFRWMKSRIFQANKTLELNSKEKIILSI